MRPDSHKKHVGNPEDEIGRQDSLDGYRFCADEKDIIQSGRGHRDSKAQDDFTAVDQNRDRDPQKDKNKTSHAKAIRW